MSLSLIIIDDFIDVLDILEAVTFVYAYLHSIFRWK